MVLFECACLLFWQAPIRNYRVVSVYKDAVDIMRLDYEWLNT